MSKIDFRSTLQRKLDVSVPGIASKLKSELRFELIRKLRSEGLHLSKGANSSLQERAYFSIVLDFLKRHEFLYALSVFLPECGAFSCEGDILAQHEILHTLGVPKDKQIEVDAPVLEQLVGIVRRELLEKPQVVDRMQQTVGPATLSLDEKLRNIELERPKESSYRGLEEKMIHFQQECDRRSRQELESEVRRIRTLERQTVRLEEADRARRKHEQMEIELRREYELKEDQLRRKEQEALDRLKMKEAGLQRKEGELRQETLRRMDETQKQNTLRNSSLAVEEERIDLQRRALEDQRRLFNEERDTFASTKQSVEDAAISKAERRISDEKVALEQESVRQRCEQQQLDAQLLALRTRESRQEQIEAQLRSTLDDSSRLGKCKEELQSHTTHLEQTIADLKRQLETQIEQCRVDRQDRERLQAEVLLQQANERSSQALRRDEERLSEQAFQAHKLLQSQVEQLRIANDQLKEDARNAKVRLDEVVGSHSAQMGKTRVSLEETWNLERRSLMGEIARVSSLHEQTVADQRNLRQDLDRSRADQQVKTEELRKLRDVLNDQLVRNKENEPRNERVSDVRRFLDKRDSARGEVSPFVRTSRQPSMRDPHPNPYYAMPAPVVPGRLVPANFMPQAIPSMYEPPTLAHMAPSALQPISNPPMQKFMGAPSLAGAAHDAPKQVLVPGDNGVAHAPTLTTNANAPSLQSTGDFLEATGLRADAGASEPVVQRAVDSQSIFALSQSSVSWLSQSTDQGVLRSVSAEGANSTGLGPTPSRNPMEVPGGQIHAAKGFREIQSPLSPLLESQHSTGQLSPEAPPQVPCEMPSATSRCSLDTQAAAALLSVAARVRDQFSPSASSSDGKPSASADAESQEDAATSDKIAPPMEEAETAGGMGSQSQAAHDGQVTATQVTEAADSSESRPPVSHVSLPRTPASSTDQLPPEAVLPESAQESLHGGQSGFASSGDVDALERELNLDALFADSPKATQAADRPLDFSAMFADSPEPDAVEKESEPSFSQAESIQSIPSSWG